MAEEYGARVTLTLAVPDDLAAALPGRVRDATAGRATLTDPG